MNSVRTVAAVAGKDLSALKAHRNSLAHPPNAAAAGALGGADEAHAHCGGARGVALTGGAARLPRAPPRAQDARAPAGACEDMSAAELSALNSIWVANFG